MNKIKIRYKLLFNLVKLNLKQSEETDIIYNNVAHNQSTNTTRSFTSKYAPVNYLPYYLGYKTYILHIFPVEKLRCVLNSRNVHLSNFSHQTPHSKLDAS
jgi:hypothetical protein